MPKKRFDMVMGPGHLSGQVTFPIDKHDEGSLLDTGWIETGLGEGTYFVMTALGLGDGKLYQGQGVLFSDAPAVLKKAKVSAAVDQKSGALRLGVKLKKSEEAVLKICWRILPLEETAVLDEAAEGHSAKDYVTPGLSEDGQETVPEDSFYIENAPATLHGGWKYTLRAHVPEGTSGKVRWELTDGDEAGTIDSYGCYTAPAKPGAYEVKAYLDAEDTDEVKEASVYLIVL